MSKIPHRKNHGTCDPKAYVTVRPIHITLYYFLIDRPDGKMGCLHGYISNLEILTSASRLAQLVERETVNLEVVGSIPILRAKYTTFSRFVSSVGRAQVS